MTGKLLKILFLSFIVFLIFPRVSVAQDTVVETETETIPEELTFEEEDLQIPAKQPVNEFFSGTVLEILEENTSDNSGFELPTQKVKIKVNDIEIETDHGSFFAIREDQKVKVGDKVVVVKAQDVTGDIYVITDHYRIDPLLILFLVLAVLAIGIGGKMVIKLLVLGGLSIYGLANYIIPQIVEGKDPLMLSAIASAILGTLLVYIYQGISKKSIVQLSSLILTILTAMFSMRYLVDFVHISGFGSEEAVFLQVGPYAGIDLKNMLLGGFIITTVMPMVYVGKKQFNFIEKILSDRKKLTKTIVAKMSIFEVGKIASLIYFVLIFGFISVSYPLFLLLNFNQDVPVWVAINSEYFSEEIVRLIVVGLIIYSSLVINSVMGVYFLVPDKKKKK